jgi:general secretion pathway protein G
LSVRYLRGNSGLTLIELMVVLFILALFSTIVVQTIGPKVKKAELETTRHQMQILAVALDTYRLDVGRYPDTMEELLESSEERWNGPYLRPAKIPKDPWGNDYMYEPAENGADFELYSSGNGEQEISFGGE